MRRCWYKFQGIVNRNVSQIYYTTSVDCKFYGVGYYFFMPPPKVNEIIPQGGRDAWGPNLYTDALFGF